MVNISNIHYTIVSINDPKNNDCIFRNIKSESKNNNTAINKFFNIAKNRNMYGIAIDKKFDIIVGIIGSYTFNNNCLTDITYADGSNFKFRNNSDVTMFFIIIKK